jgi:hypothetical protein
LVVIAGVAAAVYAAAAALGTGTGTVQSGNAAVAACQTGGFTFTNTLSGGNVQSVSVGGITSACANGNLTLNLTNSSVTSVGAGTATIPSGCSGCSVSVALSPQPPATSVVAYVLGVRGP